MSSRAAKLVPVLMVVVIGLVGILPVLLNDAGSPAEGAKDPEFPVTVRDRTRPALEERVKALAAELDALPLDDDDRQAQCDPKDIAVTYERIPPGRFKLGAYIEPLVRPHPSKGTHALGIAYCRVSPVAIMGFEALWSADGHWEIWPVPSPEDLDEH